MGLAAKLQSMVTRQWQHHGPWSLLMRPLSLIYGLIARRRRKAYQHNPQSAFRPSAPVLVIGNIYIGGTGKTPLACAIIDCLQTLGWQPGLVSRGYGRQPSPAPATGQGIGLDWRDFGDEPALIARKTGAPVSVHQDRALAAKALMTQYPNTDIIISDDGLQHYALARDFEVAVQDERGLGNGWVLPAGPLREPADRLDSVQWLLTRVTNAELAPALELAHTNRHPVLGRFAVNITTFWHPHSDRRMPFADFSAWVHAQQPILAAAGIGVPQRFFDDLARGGIALAQTHCLADHAAIDLQWMKHLPVKTILITEKDAVKLPMIADPRVWVAQTSVRWWREDINVFLAQQLEAAGIKRSE